MPGTRGGGKGLEGGGVRNQGGVDVTARRAGTRAGGEHGGEDDEGDAGGVAERAAHHKCPAETLLRVWTTLEVLRTLGLLMRATLGHITLG